MDIKGITIKQGNCLAKLKLMKDNSVDSFVMDPPYALESIVKRFGNTALSDKTQASKEARDKTNPHARTSRGFMGMKWDTGETVFNPAFWNEVMRVIKPGGHVAAFGHTKTYHRMAVAAEDAGLEIRDCLFWMYGTGFPKNTNIALAIDKSKGAVKARSKAFNYKGRGERAEEFDGNGREHLPEYKPVTDEAKQWDQWGTALKPGVEPILLARKPMSEKTIAANVLKWGTGALNIGGCRAPTNDAWSPSSRSASDSIGTFKTGVSTTRQHEQGRWPANVITDGSGEVLAMFPENGPTKARVGKRTGRTQKNGWAMGEQAAVTLGRDDEGGSAGRFFAACNDEGIQRFYWSAKAHKNERDGTDHPTVKPIRLMWWLARLVTPPGGLVCDPFAGTGTTGEACAYEGLQCVLIEMSPDYAKDIEKRMQHVRKLRRPPPFNAPLRAAAKRDNGKHAGFFGSY